jgi:hypothetical protein
MGIADKDFRDAPQFFGAPASSSPYSQSRRWEYRGREKVWRIPGPSRARRIARNNSDTPTPCQYARSKKLSIRATSSVLDSSGVQRVFSYRSSFNPRNEPAVLSLLHLVCVPQRIGPHRRIREAQPLVTDRFPLSLKTMGRKKWATATHTRLDRRLIEERKVQYPRRLGSCHTRWT